MANHANIVGVRSNHVTVVTQNSPTKTLVDLPHIEAKSYKQDVAYSSASRSHGHEAKNPKSKRAQKLAYLLTTFQNQPLIPHDIALNLLKIQSKFVSSHPCLCTSRFRHTLHLLDEEHHYDLDQLCSQLPQLLRLEDTPDNVELYEPVILCVFGDLGSLERKSNEWLERSGISISSSEENKKCTKFGQQLNNIIARLVADYRAIFAIEGEFSRSFEKSDDELHAGLEHRKRHEEGDSCPEEIKQMKVACEELTLECNATSSRETTPTKKMPSLTSSTNNKKQEGPTFCLKSLTSQGPEKDNSIHRHPYEEHNSVLEDTRCRRRRHHHSHGGGNNGGGKLGGGLGVVDDSADEKAASDDFEPTSMTSAKVISEDSTPASSDVEHSQTSSPRRPCQRKRKERRDTIGDGEAQDNKLSKSSSDVFPSSCYSQSCTKRDDLSPTASDSNKNVRKVHSSCEFVIKEVSNSKIQDDKFFKAEEEKPPQKCTFYVSDDEIPETIQALNFTEFEHDRERRAIMRPRRSRKARTDSFKENQDKPEQEQESPESPKLLPWKKEIVPLLQRSLTLSMSTPSPISTGSVPGLVAAVTSLIVLEETSDSSNCSTGSDETLDRMEVVKTGPKPIQDSHQQQMFQPISWEPHGIGLKTEAELDSTDEAAASRHFGIIHSRQHMDRSHWNRSAANESEYQETRSKIKQLGRQLSVIRKKVEDFELQFEDSNGYKPSQAEKQNNKVVRKLMLQQSRIKRQIRHSRESGDSGVIMDADSPTMSPTRPWSPGHFAAMNVYSDSSNDASIHNIGDHVIKRNVHALKNVVMDIENKLHQDRKAEGRPQDLEDMNQDQVVQENNSIQNALHQFAVIAQPTTDEERFVLKNLLHRYRSVKRLLRRSTNILIKDSCELQTIPEGSEIHLTLASPQHRINIEMNSNSSSPNSKIDDLPTVSLPSTNHPTATLGQNPNTEPNLHAMTRPELLDVQRSAKEEKRHLKRWIKEKEGKFMEENGRPMPKDEIKEHDFYANYKMTKAKLKLVDALLSKLFSRAS